MREVVTPTDSPAAIFRWLWLFAFALGGLGTLLAVAFPANASLFVIVAIAIGASAAIARDVKESFVLPHQAHQVAAKGASNEDFAPKRLIANWVESQPQSTRKAAAFVIHRHSFLRGYDVPRRGDLPSLINLIFPIDAISHSYPPLQLSFAGMLDYAGFSTSWAIPRRRSSSPIIIREAGGLPRDELGLFFKKQGQESQVHYQLAYEAGQHAAYLARKSDVDSDSSGIEELLISPLRRLLLPADLDATSDPLEEEIIIAESDCRNWMSPNLVEIAVRELYGSQEGIPPFRSSLPPITWYITTRQKRFFKVTCALRNEN